MDNVQNCYSYKCFYMSVDVYILHTEITFHLSRLFHLSVITPSGFYGLRINFDVMNIVGI
jgi:hypothetical protein